MSAQGIIPDPGYGGLVTVSIPAPAGVTNAYVPPSTFTVSTALTFYGANCSANRFDPQQLNAFESEMLCLAATINPNGTWNAGSVCNLGAAFSFWAANLEVAGVVLATAADYPGSVGSNTTAATPAYVAAAISAAFTSSLAITAASAYPSTNDTKGATAAYITAAITAALAPSSVYPGSSGSNALAATPAYVGAAIAAATGTIEGLIPIIAPASAYPSASDTKYTTPAYVTAAIAGAGGATTYAALTDVDVASLQNNQIPAWNSGASKWENIDAPYNLSVYAEGALTTSEIFLLHVLPYAIEIPSGAGASQAKSNVAATSSTTITINKNGSSIGTIVWSASGTTGAYTFASSISFAAGDIITLVAPSSADATLADVGITLAAFRI